MTVSLQTREKISGEIGLMKRIVPNSLDVATSRAPRVSGGRPMPSAPPTPLIDPLSTFKLHSGVTTHEVPKSTPLLPRPTVRMSIPRDEPSARFLGKSFLNPRKARLADFQKWVNNFNNLSDLYDHVASFKQG